MGIVVAIVEGAHLHGVVDTASSDMVVVAHHEEYGIYRVDVVAIVFEDLYELVVLMLIAAIGDVATYDDSVELAFGGELLQCARHLCHGAISCLRAEVYV